MAELAKLKRLDILSVAKFMAVYGAIIGFIAGILEAIAFAILGQTSSSGLLAMPTAGPTFGYLAIITYPIIYAILGFISGAIFAALYNLIAKWTGGIKMEFEQ